MVFGRGAGLSLAAPQGPTQSGLGKEILNRFAIKNHMVFGKGAGTPLQAAPQDPTCTMLGKVEI